MESLKKIVLYNQMLENGKTQQKISLFYQVFGQQIGTAPVVVVNHALTGNSNVAGEKGWWKEVIGKEKTIDTNFFSIIAFNIPGNGFDNETENLIANYKDFTTKDIASFFWNGLQELQVENVFAVIGGSLGGGIAWEMTALHPDKIENLIPVATDFKATDWVIANVLVQDHILNNSDDPIADARIHAMLLYRTPESLTQKFNRAKTKDKSIFEIEKWLVHHGLKLQNRFRLASYKLMNHLLKTTDISRGNSFSEVVKSIKSNIHIIGVDTDLLFTQNESQSAYQELKTIKPNVFYHQIKSIHGHDAFLIENDQLSQIISPIFNKQKKQQSCIVKK